MSLINDALNRAQAEASNKEAVARGEVPTAQEPPKTLALRRVPAWAVSIVAALAVLALVARLWNSTSGPERVHTAETPVSEPAGLQRTAPAAVEKSPVVSEPAPPAAIPPSANRSAARSPSPTEPTAAAERMITEPSETRSAPTPEAVAAEPQEPDVTAPEPVAEVPAAVEAEVTAQPTSASLPTTIWPGDGSDQETWYFVGKVELAGGGEIQLDGIAWSELAPSAVLNGSLLTVGSEILGLSVVSIAPRTVTLAGHGQRIALQLGSAAN